MATKPISYFVLGKLACCARAGWQSHFRQFRQCLPNLGIRDHKTLTLSRSKSRWMRALRAGPTHHLRPITLSGNSSPKTR
jgi:hypothetical protein